MRRLLFILAICSVAAFAPVPARKTFRILYACDRSGNFEIMLVDADGKNERNLTNHDGNDTSPSWSPNGKKIAFLSDRDGNSEIYVMDANGKNVQQLTREGQPCDMPRWSPDGKKIAFQRQIGGGNYEIFLMNADGSGQTNLTNDPSFDRAPAWSPDGKRLAFTSTRGGGGPRLFTMELKGGKVTQLTAKANPRGHILPAWSPDDKWIVYGDCVEGGVELFRCDPKGDNSKQLTNLGGINNQPAWSPDGKKIAFRHFLSNNDPLGLGGLYLMNADGSEVKPMFEGANPVWIRGITWQPR